MMNVKRVIYILVDGLSTKLFQDLMNKGRMPHIEKYLVERGFYSAKCISCFPANTAPAHVSHLTGSYIDRHKIPLIKYWVPETGRYMDFTKSSLSAIKNLNEAISNDVQTVYEYFPEGSTSLHFVNRGASDIYAGKLRSIFLYIYAKFLGWNELHHLAIKTTLQRLGNKDGSRVVVIYLPGPDAISHELGPASLEYVENVGNLDEQVRFLVEGDGKIAGLKDLGIFDDTVIVFSADHGEMEVKKVCPIDEHLKNLDLSIVTHSSSSKNIAKAEVMMAISGGVAFLNFKDQRSRSWTTSKESLQSFSSKGRSIDILACLKGIEGVGRIYLRQSPDVYCIFTKEGESRITRKKETGNPLYKYEVISGKDPLNYSESDDTRNIIGNKFHSVQDWRAATSNHESHDLIDQIPRIFDCPVINSAVIVSSSLNCSFKLKHKGEHDVEYEEIRQVPLIIAGLKKEIKVDFVSIVDILPTVLDLLSVNYNQERISGKSLVD